MELARSTSTQENINSTSNREIPFWAKAGALVAAGSMILSACGATQEATHHNRGASHSTTNPNEKGAECVTTGDIYKESANDNFVKPESMFPALYNLNKHGQQVLASTTEATSRLRERICTDTRSLAIVSYVQELRQTKQLPGQDVLDRINQLNTSFINSPEAAKNAEIQASAFLTFLTPAKNFAITKGQATEIAAVREDKKVTGLKTITINTTGTLQGFEVGFNQVDQNITPAEAALYSKLQSLILFQTDGTVVFNNFIGNTSVNFQENAPQQNVTPNNAPNAKTNVTIGPNGLKTTTQTGPNGEITITTQYPNGATTVVASGGSGIGTGTGNGGGGNGNGGTGTGNGGGGNGNGGTGTGNGGGGNGGGGSTSTTSPEGSTTTTGPYNTTTTTPETTTTTHPTTTTTTPETTTTTTAPTKGTQPGCVPNPPYVICN